MIPKVIHYCWFGRKPLPKSAKHCIASWKKHCPDYKIVEWNEDNFNVNFNDYTSQAYENGRFAFVSDVARLKVIHEFGGVYLDVDVELLRSIDPLLNEEAFMGFEGTSVATGLGFGAKVGNVLIKELLDDYSNRQFINSNGDEDKTTCLKINEKIFLKYGLKKNGEKQKVFNVTIYPTEYFCPLDFKTRKLSITSNTYSIHHYEASWHSRSERINHFLVRKNLLGIQRKFELIKYIRNLNKYEKIPYYKIALNLVTKKIIRQLPLQNIILMESMNGMDSNTGALFNEMIRQGYNEKYKIVWLVDDIEKFKNIKIKNVTFQKMYEEKTLLQFSNLNRAKFLIWDDKPISKKHSNQCSIYLSHGILGAKNVKGIINMPDDLDLALVTSEKMFRFVSDQIGVSVEKLFVCGMPRNDDVSLCQTDVKKIVEPITFKKTIVWMPTFRQSNKGDRNDSSMDFNLGIPVFKNLEQFNYLVSFLKKNNVLLLIKMHPRQRLDIVKIKDTENIKLLPHSYFLENQINLYGVLGGADALITDYSSIAFEYLLTDRQIAFTEDDLSNYKLAFKDEPTLPKEYAKLSKPGMKIKNEDDFLCFIQNVIDGNDEFVSMRQDAKDFYHQFPDFENRTRLLEILKEKVGL
ncbi:MAG: Eps7I [Bacillales bacterium]|jgi:CDP-glycerol glycerophosphotransferase (TagB/SpsB family)|nr:Eps7I [Bacillales bacterium]